MNTTVDLKKATIEQIKAMIYDQIVARDIASQNIQILQEALREKNAEVRDETKPD